MTAVAIITGGAGGMGLATARILGADHTLLLADLNQQNLDTAKAELDKAGMTCETAICDVTDRDSIDALFSMARTLGSLRCVVHTAGLSPQMADPETIMRVNALGTIYIADAALENACEGFALVNVASMSAYMLPSAIIPTRAFRHALSSSAEKFLKKALFPIRLIPGDFPKKGLAYGISKNFVMWYSRKRAGEFGAKGARILSVSPGSFDTAMGRLEEKSGSAAMLKTAALKRFGTPEEIANVLAFCASEKAGYLTGVDVLCDGGVIAGRS